MAASVTLVLATTNAGKSREFRQLLAGEPFALRDLGDYPNTPAPDEDGTTFAENARHKAAATALILNQWVLADDTGLEVDALGGDPGIRSARYAGPNAKAGRNRELLLKNLAHVKLAARSARFVCHLALSDPAGTIAAESSGSCRGRILFEPAGTGGFGYDSLFEIPEYHRTLAEIGEAAASCLTHRARAVEGLRGRLLKLLWQSERTS
jgi:XTP/dITP diphosphohydrolase